jgi:hypothetical protein
VELSVVKCCHAVNFRDRIMRKKIVDQQVLQRVKVLSFYRIQISDNFALQWSDINFIKFKKARVVGLWYFTSRKSSAVEWLSVSTSSRTVSWCSFLELFYANLSASDRHRWTAENKRSQESE